MNFKDLNREFQKEHSKESPRKSVSHPVKRPQIEHHESTKERSSLGK